MHLDVSYVIFRLYSAIMFIIIKFIFVILTTLYLYCAAAINLENTVRGCFIVNVTELKKTDEHCRLKVCL